jgi:hypothetical protein
MHGNVKKGLDDNLPFQVWLAFFYRSILGGFSQEN